MEQMQRYAVFYAPRDGAFATAAAAWLGWDAVQGRDAVHPDLGLPLADLTAGARRYGFHGTLRAPFRLALGYEEDDLTEAIADLARTLAPASSGGLQLQDLHGFLALTLDGEMAAISALAARVVEGTDTLRAPLTGDDITRRNPDQLTTRQRDLLYGWGYPFVMDEFRFHLTLTDRLAAEQIGAAHSAAQAYFSAVTPRPFVIEDLCLFGEDSNFRFHLMHRYPLSG